MSETQRQRTVPVERPIELPEDVKAIANPAVDVKLIDNFISCPCGGKKRNVEIKYDMITFRCGCGDFTSVPDDHYYFIVRKLKEARGVSAVSGANTVKTEAVIAPAPAPAPASTTTSAPAKSVPTSVTITRETKTTVNKPEHTCKDCGDGVTKEQAVGSFNLIGRALCSTCLGRALA